MEREGRLMPIKIGDITVYKIEEILAAFSKGGQAKLSKQTIRRYIRDKKLKGQKVGGVWWITEDSLRDWLGAVPETQARAQA